MRVAEAPVSEGDVLSDLLRLPERLTFRAAQKPAANVLLRSSVVENADIHVRTMRMFGEPLNGQRSPDREEDQSGETTDRGAMMLDCPIHGLTGFVNGCRHFEDAVDARAFLPVSVRVGFGEVLLLCSSCAAAVDLERGVSSETLDSKVGMEPHARHIACIDCAAETYQGVIQPDLVTWLTARRSMLGKTP